mmetsp:Transcript_30590/g.88650  ORF Transcript_30590/g.88650 Transcript_30590/m.88650 type:complete len:217 (+) Transcript_30590:1439-2089(+)
MADSIRRQFRPRARRSTRPTPQPPPTHGRRATTVPLKTRTIRPRPGMRLPRPMPPLSRRAAPRASAPPMVMQLCWPSLYPTSSSAKPTRRACHSTPRQELALRRRQRRTRKTATPAMPALRAPKAGSRPKSRKRWPPTERPRGSRVPIAHGPRHRLLKAGPWAAVSEQASRSLFIREVGVGSTDKRSEVSAVRMVKEPPRAPGVVGRGPVTCCARL